MAVRINQYESRVDTPSGQVAGAEGRVVPGYELDFSGFARAANQIAAAKEQSEINNARAELASWDPKAQLDFRNEYNRIARQWAPGQAPIAEQISTYINDYATQVESSLSNPRTKPLVRERANELRTLYMLQGADQQVKNETDFRIGKYVEGYKTIQLLGMDAPERFGVELAKFNQAIMDDSQLSLLEKQALVQKHSNEAAFQVSKVQAEADAPKALAITGALLGISEPTMQVQDSMVDAIMRLESDNRLYGDDGQILRGPAIPTPQGAIHAYGPYQLLESTAREQARKLGIPWNREVFLRGKSGDAAKDAETAAYHDQLGQAYIADQAREFGGDPILIAAAHNMGPEATRGWAAGRPYQTQSGKWWRPKGPKDMAALPEETKKYLGRLGKIETGAATPTTISGEDAVPYKLLSPEQLLTVRSAAQSRLAEVNREKEAKFAVDRALFTQRLTDIEAAAKAGDAIDVPPMDEMVTFLGPAQAILRTRQLQNYQVMAAGLKQMPGLSNDELVQLSRMPNPEGADDRENRQFVRDTTVAKAKELLALRASDPGLAAVQSSPQVQAAYGEWQAAANAFHSAGAQATPEQFEARNAAQSRYVNASFAQQRQWGVLEPKLPNDVATKLAHSFAVELNSGDPRAIDNAAFRMALLPKQMGSHAALAQIAGKTGDLGWFAMEKVPGAVLAQMAQAKAIKPEEQTRLLSIIDTTPDMVRKAVNVAFAPLTGSFAMTGLPGADDNTTATRYLNGGATLATQYLINGTASSPKEAARMAYQALYADRGTVANGVRIPNDFDADAVSEGLRRRINSLEPRHLFFRVSMPGLTREETQAQELRNIRRNGRWVTNSNGTGALLTVGGKLVFTANGDPLELSFQGAQDEPIPEAETEREKARLDSLARGLK